MAQVILGDRIARQAKALLVACGAAIFDDTRQKILLTRRSDNGQWCLPGGQMELGESAAETCAREVLEETGLQVDVGRLIGVYSDPHRLIDYGQGNRFSIVVLIFEATPTGGTLGLSNETTEYGYYPRDEIDGMDVMRTNLERIADAFAACPAAFVR